MDLKTRIQEDIKQAMRARASERLATLRLLSAAMKRKEVDERIELTDALVISIVEKEIKLRKDALTQYESAQRFDLAEKERAEIAVIAEYLPVQMDAAEIERAIEQVLQEQGVSDVKEMGKAMAVLKSLLAGKADMALVSKILKTKLSA